MIALFFIYNLSILIDEQDVKTGDWWLQFGDNQAFVYWKVRDQVENKVFHTLNIIENS